MRMGGGRRILAATAVWGLGALAAPAYAVDVNPYDWMPAPDGTRGLILYAPLAHNTSAVINGARLDASLDVGMLMPRYVHYFDVDGHPLALTALLPLGRLSDGALGGAGLGRSKSLVGDLTLAAGYWLYSNPKERKNLVLATYLNVPMGSYDRDRPLNMSSGQLAATLQLGGMIALSEKWTLEPTVDVTFYRDKSNATGAGQKLSMDNSYSIQNWLTYSINATTSFHMGHVASFGGTKKYDGVETGFNARKQQIKLGLTHWITPTLSIYGHVGRDFDVQGGFKGTSAMLRLVKLF